MQELPVLLARTSDLAFLAPLIVTVSLVYSASRHESMSVIVRQALRVALWMAGFMAAVLALLAVLTWLF
jgi:hypothetical protein